MRTIDDSKFGHFERKVLRKIFGSLRFENGEYRSLWIDELYDIYGEIDRVQRIKKQWRCWLGYVVRMDKNILALKAFDPVLVIESRGRDTPFGKTKLRST